MPRGRWLLAVDPGIRGCGAALFHPGEGLVRAAYVRSPARSGNRAREAADAARAVYGWLIDDDRFVHGYDLELAVEWMQVYAGRIAAGDADAFAKDPNDLLPLTGIDAALAALCPEAPCASYLPREWKGQLKKPACHARARGERLWPNEAQIWDVAAEAHGSLAHNVFDAVCIGLHHLGRGFTGGARRRVYPGARP